jgi:hypothetical protein
MKLTMYSWPIRMARGKPASRAAGRNSAPAKAIIPWLRYICSGRVRLVDRLSSQAATATISRAIRAGVLTCAGD